MMNITLLTGLYPREIVDSISLNSDNYLDNAANAFQWALVDGFEENNCKLNIINLPFVGSFPLRYRKIKVEGRKFCKTKKGSTFETSSFNNLSLYKMISRYGVTKKRLFQSSKNFDIIFLYSISSPFLKAAVEYRRRNPSAKLCILVADLPEYMSESRSILYRILKYIDRQNINRYLTEIDFFVLLSKHMINLLPIGNKPYLIMEGIYNSYDDGIVNKFIYPTKTIMYSGTLAKRYGIMNLVVAFSKISNPNYRLLICGNGDAKEDIVDYSKLDTRILFKGNIKREEVLKLQKEAYLLINPRTSEGNYTMYSFPSKTMEYLASGTPTLLYRLPGIPEEYYDFSFQVNENSVECLALTIENILEKPKEELEAMGNRAREFIINNKNAKVQTLKILNFIKDNI